MTVQNIFAIDNCRGRGVTQSEVTEKGYNKQKKEYLHTTEYPARLPAKGVYAFGPPLNSNQGNRKGKDAQMQEKGFPFQFVQSESNEACDENADGRNKTETSAIAITFRINVFCSTLCLIR
jgi:hypothetical protein